MVVSEVIDVSTSLVSELGKIGLFLQTLGIAVLVWILVQIALFVINKKKLKAVMEMKEEFKRMEKKIDVLTREVRKINRKS